MKQRKATSVKTKVSGSVKSLITSLQGRSPGSKLNKAEKLELKSSMKNLFKVNRKYDRKRLEAFEDNLIYIVFNKQPRILDFD